MITEKQQNQLDYMEQAVSQMRSAEVNMAIELKERDTREKRRDELLELTKKRIENQPRKIFINHLYKHIDINDITEEMEEKESEFIINND